MNRLLQIFRAKADNKLMALFLRQFANGAATLEHVFLGQNALATFDSRNLEAILSAKFADLGYGNRRDVFYPLLDDGIFTQDGTA